MSLSNKGVNNGMYGKKHSEESKEKMSQSHKKYRGEKHPFYGRKHLIETKIKISKTKKGKEPWNKNKICLQLSGKNNPMYNKKHLEETKRKISEKQKISNKRYRIVKIDNIVYNGITLASKKLNITYKAIRYRCESSKYNNYKYL